MASERNQRAAMTLEQMETEAVDVLYAVGRSDLARVVRDIREQRDTAIAERDAAMAKVNEERRFKREFEEACRMEVSYIDAQLVSLREEVAAYAEYTPKVEQQRDTARALLAEAREYIKADAGMDEHYMILDRIDAALIDAELTEKSNATEQVQSTPVQKD